MKNKLSRPPVENISPSIYELHNALRNRISDPEAVLPEVNIQLVHGEIVVGKLVCALFRDGSFAVEYHKKLGTEQETGHTALLSFENGRLVFSS